MVGADKVRSYFLKSNKLLRLSLLLLFCDELKDRETFLRVNVKG